MTANGHHAVFSPQVIHTGTAPTGYQVTFRYYDPAATTVQVRGEWFFSSPAGTTTTSSQGLLPAQWQPGDFPIAYPNQGPAPNWPVAQMTLNKATGVWSYTTPLPSGTFTYGFYVNCTSPPPGLAGCTELSDPGNPPWNKTRLGGAGQSGLRSLGSAVRHAEPVLAGAEPVTPGAACWTSPIPTRCRPARSALTRWPSTCRPATTRGGVFRTRRSTSATEPAGTRSTGPLRAPRIRSWTT